MGRRWLRIVGFASGALAGTVAYRRVFGAGRERIDVYFDDGSFVTFAGRSPEAAKLLPLAQRVVAAVRPA
ncbi:MAG TPA: hypothetical protein VJQ07_11450 [Gaiellaceae bacterium]|nr:hypothetical protein [Gaiellaceae bacterium]